MADIITVKNTTDYKDTTAKVIIKNSIDYIPKISVVIPVYNAEKYLEECLDSVINQTLKEIEIICVDDGSKDNSLNILKEYAQKDNRVTILSQENLYAGVARNAGIAVAKGEYIHFLDSDDWIDKNTYEELYSQIKKVKTNVMKFKSYTFDNQQKQVVDDYFTDMGGVANSYFNQILNCDKNYSTLIKVSDAPWSGIYKLDFIKKNKCYFDNLLCSNDVSFYYRCLVKTQKLYLWDKKFVYYRVNNNKSLIGIRAYNFDNQIQCYKNIVKVISNLSKKNQVMIKTRLIQDILYRYERYMEEEKLDIEVKKEITSHVSEFLKNINEDLIVHYCKNLYRYLLGHPDVSVIIPVYNSEKYLRQCLDSVIHQTLKSIEIICVDDGSTDNSLDILKEYEKKDIRIKVLKQENRGSAAARNYGIDNATGDFIGFVDSDDYISDNFFYELYNSAISKNAEIVATANIETSGNEEICDKYWAIEHKNIIYETIEQKQKIIILSGVSWNKIYSKKLLNINNLRCLEIKNAAEDNYFTDLSVIFANKIVFNNNAKYFYVLRNDSQTQTLKTNEDFKVIEVYKSITDRILSSSLNIIDKQRWLDVINMRKINDYTVFYQTMNENHKTEFKQIAQNDLKNNIIISLTSYPARINTVNETIETLLNQSFNADKVILWLAVEEFPNKEKDLPPQLLSLKNKYFNFEIEWCTNIHSYKKLIPALKKYPDKIIVTADDDILYSYDWLEKLYISYLKAPKQIHCHRAHRILLNKNKILPYNKWVQQIEKAKPSFNNFFTGAGGVLYPAHSLLQDVLNQELFMKHCPKADDIWFWAMAVLNNTKINVVEKNKSSLDYVADTQEGECLWKTNCLLNKNDEQLQAILNYYPQILKKLDKRKFNPVHNTFLEQIFSVKNSQDRKHKVITICNLKIKLKKNKH